MNSMSNWLRSQEVNDPTTLPPPHTPSAPFFLSLVHDFLTRCRPFPFPLSLFSFATLFPFPKRFLLSGFHSIVPLEFLSSFTWRDLERRLCGSPLISANSLRERVKYDGYFTEKSSPVSYFWDTVDRFSPEELSLLLRFVCGRSRLPPFDSSYLPFMIQPLTARDSPPDSLLPQARTCFFTLSLPHYSSREILEDKLRYAILSIFSFSFFSFIVFSHRFLPLSWVSLQ